MKKNYKINLKIGIIFCLFFFFFTNLQSQTLTQTVKGKVIDIDTEIPIEGAAIVLVDSNPVIGTTTDVNGNYKLTAIPIGRQSFKISFLGYEDVYLKEILIESGREVILSISMKEIAFELETIVIKSKNKKREPINQMTTVSSHQITVESTSRIAAGINDLGRTVQSIAGVSTSSDKSNELVIRGNSPRGVLWRMEGIEIPNPNHFSSEGGSGGGVSVLSTQVLANSDFMISAFSAEYGNAISGVYDLKLRKGNSEKREYAIQVGVLGLQLAAEGPLKKDLEASYLFNYRYSTFALLNKFIGTTIGGSLPTWQDVSFNMYVPTKKFGNFSIWGLGGNSLLENLAVKDASQWNTTSDYRQEKTKNSLFVTGVTHQYLFDNNKTYIKTTISKSFTNNLFIKDTLDVNYNTHPTLDLSYQYHAIRINSYVNHKFNAQDLIRFGVSTAIKGYNVATFDLYADEKTLETKGSTNSYQWYAQWKHRITNDFELISGLHSSYLQLNNNYTIEPRLGLKWNVNKKNTLSFGFGLHSKSEPVSVYLWEENLSNGSVLTPNKNLGYTKAVHYVLGYNWNFAKDFRLKTEAYYQHIYDVPIDKNDITGTKSSLNYRTRIENTKLTNDGLGRNYGVEITLEKYFSNNWYALLTSSLFESKYKMPGFKERNTLFNTNFIYNVVAGKEVKFGNNNQHTVGFNLRTTWRGGYRNIPYNLAESINQNKPVYEYNNAYKQRLSDYYRIDVGANYSYNKSNMLWKLSVDIQNVLNTQNVSNQYFNSSKNKIISEFYQGITPNVNLIVAF